MQMGLQRFALTACLAQRGHIETLRLLGLDDFLESIRPMFDVTVVESGPSKPAAGQCTRP